MNSPNDWDESLAEAERLTRAGASDRAVTLLLHVIATMERAEGAEASDLIRPLWCLAQAHRSGQDGPSIELDRALEAEARCLALAESPPRDDRQLAAIYGFHSASLWLNRQHPEALASLARAIEIAEGCGLETRDLQAGRVEILIDAGRCEEALQAARKLVGHDEDVDGRAADYSLYLLGDSLRRCHRAEEARRALEDLLSRPIEPGMAEVAREWLSKLV